MDALIAERASGDLDPADAQVLEAHLPRCARCRAELAAYEETFALVQLDVRLDAPPRLPLASGDAAEGQVPGRALRPESDVAAATLAEWRLLQRRRRTVLALCSGFAAAAALSFLAVTLRHPLRAAPAQSEVASAAGTGAAAPWEPDVMGVIEDARETLASGSGDEGSDEIALAGYAAADLP
jgi:hypothetical protein